MSSLKNILVLLIIGLSVSGLYSCGICSKKIDCPGFKDNQLSDAFPYSDQQQLIFINDSNVKESITLNNTLTSQPYQIKSSLSTPHCNGEKLFTSAEIDSTKRPVFSLDLTVTTGINDSLTNRSVSMNIKGTSIVINYFNHPVISFATIDYMQASVTNFGQLSLGSTNFSNVTRINLSNPVSTTRISEIYLAQYKGIVAYKDYPSGKLWVKQ